MFSLDWPVSVQPTVGGAPPELVVLDAVTDQAEQAMGSNPGSSILHGASLHRQELKQHLWIGC